MTTFAKERLRERAIEKVNKLERVITQSAFTAIREGLEEELELARIALASLEADDNAEPVAFINGAWTLVYYRPPKELGLKIGDKLFTAPPAPVALNCFKRLLHHAYGMTMGHDWNIGTMAGHHRAKLCQAVDDCRAAMQGKAEPVTTDYKLPDGWVAVPVEPTTEMYDAGDRQLATKQVWDAMIAAAPQQEAK